MTGLNRGGYLVFWRRPFAKEVNSLGTALMLSAYAVVPRRREVTKDGFFFATFAGHLHYNKSPKTFNQPNLFANR